MSIVISSSDTPKEGVKTILEAVKRLGEEEKVFEEMVRVKIYYLGYLPATFKVVANRRPELATLGSMVFVVNLVLEGDVL